MVIQFLNTRFCLEENRMATNTLSYVDFDFDTIVAQLQDRMANRNAWKDLYRSSTGEVLLEVMAYVLNMGLFYTERRAEESYLPTAKLRSSVVNLVSLIGYSPKRKSSSTGNLQFSITSPLSKIVYIPKYTECQTADGVKYLTNASAAIEKGATSVTVEGIQGELIQTDITSDGSLNQEYAINDISVENSGSTTNQTLRVIIDGVEWTEVSSFYASEVTDTHFRVIDEMDGTITVQFGDDINGKSPDSGSVIRIQYVKSDGLGGNVTNTGYITTLNDTIYDEDGSVVSGVSVSNSSSFLGGDDAESIEEIRYEAPQVFTTGDRAVNRDDFISIIGNYSGVADVNVWGENEEAEAAGVDVDVEMLNKVKISTVLQEWQLPDSVFKSNLSAHLYAKSMLTVKYEYVTPVVIYVIPRLWVSVVGGESLSQAQADIETALAAQFSLGDTTSLGTTVKYSNVLAAIDDLNRVAYANMDLEIYKVLSNSYNSSYDWGALLEVTDIEPGTVRVYLDGVYTVTDVDSNDGTGTFTASGVSGTVNYSTGEVLIDAPAATNAYVRYQQNQNGNIVPTFRQVCKLQDVDIVSISNVS